MLFSRCGTSRFASVRRNFAGCRSGDGGKVKRLLGTGAGIIFKGSGFYSTDYRSNSYKEAAKKEAPGSDKPKAEAKGERATKPPTPEKKSE
jgi:Uncharacterized protein conserved in bacteria